MARIRTVKPELFRHEVLYQLEAETGLPIRIAFVGLFTACDRKGRFKWRPRELKLDVLPYDDVNFSRVLDALATRGFIRKYIVQGVEYGFIPSFLVHQVINNREQQSILPDPPQPTDIQEILTRAPRVGDACSTPLVQDQGEGKGREGKGTGREGEGRVVNASTHTHEISTAFRLPANWEPDREMWEASCLNAGVNPDYSQVLEQFRMYWCDQTRLHTERQWQGKLIAEIKRNYVAKNNSPPPTDKSPRPDNLRRRSLHDDLTDRSWSLEGVGGDYPPIEDGVVVEDIPYAKSSG